MDRRRKGRMKGRKGDRQKYKGGEKYRGRVLGLYYYIDQEILSEGEGSV
jgi:hypothetical protein